MFWNLQHLATSSALVNDSNQEWTYGQLADCVAMFCSRLPRATRKQLGFIFCQNNLSSLVAYLSGLQRGDAICLLDAKMNRTFSERLIALYQPDWIMGQVNGVQEKSKDFDAEPLEGIQYDLLQHSRNADLYPIHPDLAVLLATSGTTGSSKLVRLSYINLQANAQSINDYLQLNPFQRPITTLPMSYSYGLSVVNSHLLCGATLLLTNQSITARPFWEFFKKQGATSLAGVPYTYQMLSRMRLLDSMALPTLQILTQAGGRLDPKLVEHFQKIAVAHDWRFFVMYGATEATARMSYLPPEHARTKSGSIGIPIPGGTFQIATSGELIYVGPNVMMGYAESREDLSRGDELQGVLHTGDLAQQDVDGYYYIVGRMSRFLKLFGLRINLDDVERLIEDRAQTPVACTGTDDKLWVFVERASAAEIAEQQLSNTYHLHHTAFRIKVISEISRNPNGKIAYKELNEWMS